jgi:low temperature requirement protein LtrA
MCLPARDFDHFCCSGTVLALHEGENFVFGGLRLWRWWGLCGAVPDWRCRHFRRSLMGRKLGAGHAIIYLHFLIYAGLGAIATAIGFAIMPELAAGDYRTLMALGLLSFMVAFQLLHFFYHAKEARKLFILKAIGFNVLAILWITFTASEIIILMGVTALVVTYTILQKHRQTI